MKFSVQDPSSSLSTVYPSPGRSHPKVSLNVGSCNTVRNSRHDEPVLVRPRSVNWDGDANHPSSAVRENCSNKKARCPADSGKKKKSKEAPEEAADSGADLMDLHLQPSNHHRSLEWSESNKKKNNKIKRVVMVGFVSRRDGDEQKKSQ